MNKQTVLEEVSLVMQRGPADCEVAAMAMVLNCSYEEAASELEWDDTAQIIRVRREAVWAKRGIAYARFWKDETGWPPKPRSSVSFCLVTAREQSPGGHAVVMLADGSVLDPTFGEWPGLAKYHAVHEVFALVPLGEMG